MIYLLEPIININIIKLILVSSLLVSCGIFDSGGKELVGGYSVGWVDTPCSMQLYHGERGITKGQVFSVGFNNKFIIAKRHPECNQNITDYFIIKVNDIVFGPLNENEFMQKRKELGVPINLDFTLNP